MKAKGDVGGEEAEKTGRGKTERGGQNRVRKRGAFLLATATKNNHSLDATADGAHEDVEVGDDVLRSLFVSVCREERETRRNEKKKVEGKKMGRRRTKVAEED